MADAQVVSSFVLRFSPLEREEHEEPRYRIRVTHVQDQDEIVVGTLQDAMNYIEDVLKRG